MYLYGLLCDHITRRGVVVEVAPTTRAMYATGSGRAKKPEVLAAVRLSFPGVRVSNDNAADALALAAMGSRNLGRPLEAVDLTSKQMAAGQTLPWPNRKDQ
jgi:crossover junction endodeoxyribonuclease RuvC